MVLPLVYLARGREHKAEITFPTGWVVFASKALHRGRVKNQLDAIAHPHHCLVFCDPVLLKQFDDVEDYFIFVSNGNENALEFYQRKGFTVSHEILDGFITVLRNK